MDIAFFIKLEEPNRIRVHILTERGNILKALCQYESLIDDNWTPIVRYDNAHGFFHKDIFYSDGTKEKRDIYYLDLNTAFNDAVEDLKNNWQSYFEIYMNPNWR